jgi:hypothetical protein
LNSRLIASALALCSAAFLPLAAHATLITYDITYTGTGTFVGGETATGSGFITFDVSSLGPKGLAAVTGFSFTDTIDNPVLGDVTFTYGLGDLSSSSEIFAGTLTAPILTNLQLQTNYIAGTTNTNYSATDFNLAYSPAVAESTAGANSLKLGDFTSGSGTVTADASVSVVPEPSSYVLFATGIAGAALLSLNRKRSAASLT